MIAPSNESAATLDSDVFTLPPLILHPFSDATGPSRLVESSRASLMLHGLLPNGEYSSDELERRLLDGRYCELRMVYYVGRDVMRWIDQCMDVVSRNPEAFPTGLQLQSFAAYLVENSPECVQEKLRKWGVNDYRSIFARGIALNVMFEEAPVRGQVGDGVRPQLPSLCRSDLPVLPEPVHMGACRCPARGLRAVCFRRVFADARASPGASNRRDTRLSPHDQPLPTRSRRRYDVRGHRHGN